MLSKESFQAALPMAEEEVLTGRMFVPATGSLIDQLSGQAMSAFDAYTRDMDLSYIYGSNGTLDGSILSHLPELSALMEDATTGGGVNPTPHSLSTDDSIRSLSRFAIGHISFARNEVMPVVKDTTAKVAAFFQMYAPQTAQDSIMVEEYTVPGILRDESFLSQLSHMEGKTPLSPDRILNFPVKSTEEIIEHLRTDQRSTDELIMPWATNLTEDQLRAIWTNFFSHLASEGGPVSIDYQSFQSARLPQRIDIALAVYLIASNLQVKVETTTDQISLAQYKMYMEQAKDWAAASLWQDLRTVAMYEKTSNLVLSVDTGRKKITVLDTVYDKFLSEGGSPEVLQGLVVSDRFITTTSAVLAAKSDLLQRWSSYVMYYNALKTNNRVTAFREFLVVYIDTFLKSTELKSIELFRKENSRYDEEVKKLIGIYVNQLENKDFDDIHEIGLTIGASILFYFTDSFTILKGIEEAAQANPAIDVREAALLSTIAYLSDYVSSMIVLVDNKHGAEA